ncbi:hypothetical protein [Rubritalea tangerina]|uniref:Uncharacterized protein n=1 Tax=Rubritalea tangerina TaxID=430798 RepID=A0ABW4Z892_9BACT
MSNYGNSTETPGISLPTLVAQLRNSCEAAARFQAGSTCYAEEIGIFRRTAEELRLFLDTPPPELARSPDDEGNEHQVWFRPDSASFLKATWPDHFGMLVVHRADEEPAASPIAYLERWLLHNEIFGDSVEFLGALDTDQGMRLLISQPAILGQPATDAQIKDFFTSSGWKRFQIANDIAYFEPQRQIVVSDTHRGNLILMGDGLLAPIDLRVQPLTPSLLDIVTKLTQ